MYHRSIEHSHFNDAIPYTLASAPRTPSCMNKTNKPTVVSKSLEISGRTMSFEIGKLAEQANAAVLARYGDTVVLVTAVSAKERTDLDYFPLSVEYAEKLYAGGRIKGSRWVKREGRPTDDAVLKGRLIDRSIRPLFPKDFKRDVQVIATILSVDGENDPDVLALNAASAALAVSDIPWDGPIGAVRMGSEKKDGDAFIVNPLRSQMDNSVMDLVVSASKDKVLMIEAGMDQVPEDTAIQAIETAKKEIQAIIGLIEDFVKDAGKKKFTYISNELDKELVSKIDKDFSKDVEEMVAKRVAKEMSGDEASVLADKIIEKYGEDLDKKVVLNIIDKLFKKQVRKNTLKNKQRPDGRDPFTVRPIWGEVGVLPRTHGSAIFTRGQSQALTITTLAAPGMEQLIESPEGEESKSYMHHYIMPPYSVGETGRFGSPGRREIGHGALAERALEPVVPAADVFPYTIRVVSEILSSNGSTSMASVCGSTLSLMDAGVPILEPVSGIAMGLVADSDEDFIILSDIMGIEDFTGDMDFKVAGTKNGITAIQMDTKRNGLTDAMVRQTISQAREGRMHIMGEMMKVLSEPRTAVSQYAPKVHIIRVPVDKIGEVIGPGGKVIRNIIAMTQATVDIDDDGTVTITATDENAVAKAVQYVEGLVKEVQPGEEYEGEVKRILPFGAFVEILPGKEGLVHVSQMSTEFVNDPNEVVKLGQMVKVRVSEIDSQGRTNLSMLFGEDAKARPERSDRGADRPRFEDRGDRGPRRDERGGSRPFRPRKRF